jgi:tRNA (guanine37-N1)-methyltransferase
VHNVILNILQSIGHEKDVQTILHQEKKLQDEENQNKIVKIHKKIFKIIEKIQQNVVFIHFSPRGKLLNQRLVKRYYKQNNNKSLILLCGRYEGIDARVIEYWNFQEISIGDYILTNGDMASLVFIDSYLRLHPGILGNYDSVFQESFENYLLEANNYTKPIKWNGISCPNVLLSGNHFLIHSWKNSESQRITSVNRPDLWSKYIENKENTND